MRRISRSVRQLIVRTLREILHYVQNDIVIYASQTPYFSVFSFHFPPSGLLGPFCPFSVTITWNKRSRHKHSGQHNPISQEKAADATLGKNPDDGLYLAYCSLSGLFVSGSICLPYREKLVESKTLRTIQITLDTTLRRL